MLSVDQLRDLINARVAPLAARQVALSEARGLRLAQEVLAPSDEPAFDRSAMDGFAIEIGASTGFFRVVGESLPGGAVPRGVAAGEALRVFTGSALPPGVRVVMQEDTESLGDGVQVRAIGRPTHVRLRGSAVRQGGKVLPEGCLLSPACLAILAAAGVVRPRVTGRPGVAHLTTGTEIIEASREPAPGQIRNTNAPLIQALLEESGASLLAHRHAGEDPREGLAICREDAFELADVLLISGGSSGGAHDHPGEILEALGFESVCRRVSCRPGKPLIIGVKEGRVALGLPGNPLSHFVIFHVFVRHVLSRLAGLPVAAWKKQRLCPGAVIAADSRETFWPAALSEDGVSALLWLDSGHLNALAGVNALIRVPGGEKPLSGEFVEVVSCGIF